jgi:multicomponent Na+:H+ antiporter subunit F
MTLFEGPTSFLQLAGYIGFGTVVIAMCAALVRVVIGPSLADRVLALDLMGLLSVSLIALYAIASAQSLYLDAAIALALISFLGTVAFARFIEWRGEEHDHA